MKEIRQKEILQIIANQEVGTQAELARMLRARNFSITQATVSRDIKELGLVKALGAQGRHHYVLPPDSPGAREHTRLERTIRDTVVGVDGTDHLILVKTLPGSAQLLASLLDQSGWEDVMGTIAGDDTVLMIVRDRRKAAAVCERIRSEVG